MKTPSAAVLKSEAAEVGMFAIPVLSGPVVGYHVEALFRPVLGAHAIWAAGAAAVLMVVCLAIVLHAAYGPQVAELRQAAHREAAGQ